jgi:hypothetical protein
MNPLLINVIGWTGAVMLLFAFALVSLRGYAGTSTTYQWLNIVGSAFLIINTCYYGAYPSAFVNVVWIGIALAAMLRARRGNEEPIVNMPNQ